MCEIFIPFRKTAADLVTVLQKKRNLKPLTNLLVVLFNKECNISSGSLHPFSIVSFKLLPDIGIITDRSDMLHTS